MATARLVRRVTTDGLMAVNDNVPIGKVYLVDLATRTVSTMQHSSGMLHAKEVVQCSDGGWIPVALLDIDQGRA